MTIVSESNDTTLPEGAAPEGAAPRRAARDIFDPFDHGADDVPNLLRPEDAVMLGAEAAKLVAVHEVDMVDPNEARVVDPNEARVVDPNEARVVTPEDANIIDPNDAHIVVAERADAADDPGRLAASDTLVVIGAPGSGKTTVGALVAERLGVAFCDVDALIEQRAGKPIGEIFVDDGEQVFRRMEETITLEALGERQVVSLGGGAVMSPRIRVALADHPVAWLEVTATTAINRAGLNSARPLLVGNVRGTLIKLLAERTPVYQALATVTIANDGDDPAATADAVVQQIAALAEQVDADSGAPSQDQRS